LVRAPHDTVYRYSKPFLWMLDSVVSRLNTSFYIDTKILDTVSTKPIAIKGLYPLYKIPYLKRDVTRVTPLTRFEPFVSENDHPAEYRLEQNYPNPFNPTTTIEFELPAESKVVLKIYNILGEEVATLLDNITMDEGSQSVEFNAINFASGVYFYRLETSGIGENGEIQHFTFVKKMILLK